MLKSVLSTISYAVGWSRNKFDEDFSDEDNCDNEEVDSIISQIFIDSIPPEGSEEEIENIATPSPAPILKQIGSGRITHLSATDGIINDKYFFIRKEANSQGLVLDLDQEVTYVALRKSDQEEWRVKEILSIVCDENWGEEVSDDKEKQQCEPQIIPVEHNSRTIHGKVTNRDGRYVVVRDYVQLISPAGSQPRDTRFSLDEVSSVFTPLEGDFVIMDALVELSEDTIDGSGDVIEVRSIRPTQGRMVEGQVTFWEKNRGRAYGIIDDEIYFLRDACEAGYVPRKNDEVKVEAIDSEQLRGKLKWRATVVQPLKLEQRSEDSRTPRERKRLRVYHEIDPNLLRNKGNIVVQEDCNFGRLHVEGDFLIEVVVTNIGDVKKVLNYELRTAPSNLTCVFPASPSVVINAHETMTFTFKYNKTFYGCFTEEFIVKVQGHEIGRLITWEVFGSDIQDDASTKLNDDQFYLNARSQLSQQFIGLEQNRLACVPGVRPCKAPSFVKTRIGLYPVPNDIKKAMTSGTDGGLLSRKDAETALKRICPNITEALSITNFCQRFHNLLYIAEMDGHIDICKYTKERVNFSPCGPAKEYLSLRSPGLSEGRPSVIIGDKIIAKKSWSDEGNVTFEGFVHKVLKDEVWLKFNSTFHSIYGGEDYDVYFQLSRGVFRKCHAALDICQKNQAGIWLFPKGVKSKPPQVVLVEDSGFYLPPVAKEENDTNDKSVSVNDQPHESTPSFKESGSSVATFFESFKSSPEKSEAISNQDIIDVNRIESSLQGSEKKWNQGNGLSEEGKGGDCDHSLNRGLEADATFQADSQSTSNLISTQVVPKQLKSAKKVDEMYSHRRKTLKWCNTRLNERQKDAVRNILKGEARPLPYVIFGPPGTGKTMTLVETILQIFQLIENSRILVATPSNSSANLFAERLLNSGCLQPGDMVRLVAFSVIAEGRLPAQLLPYCATVDISSGSPSSPDAEESRGVVSLGSQLLLRHRIIIGTCATLGQIMHLGVPPGHFTHVAVDEAGQATEPEILIPLGFVAHETGQSILAGDPNQLGPVVPSTLAGSFGLKKSLLSRLLNRFPYERDPTGFPNSGGWDPRLVTRLTLNYRSLPDILDLPSSLFYDSDLEPWISDTDSYEAKLLERITSALPLPRSAVVFHGVRGPNFRDDDSPSFYNPMEMWEVTQYVGKLYKAGIECNDIGIITPYQKQVAKIRLCLERLELDIPKVGSVEDFQGQERLVIILSTVRSAGADHIDVNRRNALRHLLGFVNNPERLNVAISRARALLIIVGDPCVLWLDTYWRSVVKYCYCRKSYLGTALPRHISDECEN